MSKEEEAEERAAKATLDIMVKAIAHLSGGNAGSAKALLEIMNPIDNVLIKEQRAGIMEKMRLCKIHENAIYTYYNDICNRDLKCMSYLAENANNELLSFACQLDDYGGRLVLKDVLDQYYAISDETSD